jgi:flagellin
MGLTKSLERLSSGFRINRAADDAAGLSVSMRFRAQIRSLQQASRNATEGNSVLQVAEGGADQITNILTRMKELATQAASSNTTSSDRNNIADEVDILEQEIDRIANSTKYGSSILINGSFGTTNVTAYGALAATYEVISVDVSGASALTTYNVAISTGGGVRTMSINDGTTTQTVAVTYNTIANGSTQTLSFNNLGISVKVNAQYDTAAAPTVTGTMLTGSLGQSIFQVGDENNANHQISFAIGDMTTGTDGLNLSLDVSSISGAQLALTDIDSAIGTLADRRADIGVTQNRFGFTIANIATQVENITASESVIRDADFAFETIAFTKNQILLQAGTAMLAQSNLAPQVVLSLLT